MEKLLYQIDEQAQNVTFTIVKNKEDIHEAILCGKRITLPFEEIIKNVAELKNAFRNYEKSTHKITEQILSMSSNQDL